jgi:Uma2 family endonuclease
MSSSAIGPLRRHRLTVDEYHRMAEVGILGPETRIELIDGQIIDMPPPGSLHAGTVAHTARLFERAAGDAAVVWTQNPLMLDEHSEPQPDIALLRPRADYYRSRHPQPGDVLLAVEVADSSLRYDRRIKMPLYARRGIVESWIVDVQAQRITQYREPRDDGYAYARVLKRLDAVEVVALRDLRLDLRPIFAE